MRKRLGILCVFALVLIQARADAAFSRRKPITIDPLQVAGPSDLNDFPVLISLVDTDLELAPSGDVTSAVGHDILFRGEDDTTCGGVGTSPCVLDHEIESYDGSSGTLVAFVRVPVLQTAVSTVIYIYYGDSGVTSALQNPDGVWDANYREVFHLHETGDHTDSTVNGYTAVTKGTVNQGVAGQIGLADDFIGPTESRLIISDGELGANTSFTFEAWVYIRSLQAPGTWTGLVIKGRDSNADWVGIGKTGSDTFALFWQCCNPPTQPGNLNGPALSAGQWYYMSATYDSGTTTRTIYLDGSPVGTDTLGAQYPALPEFTRVGDDSNGNYHDGLIDEVRISDVARSADWILTTYNNQFAPGTFYLLGAEDSSPPAVDATTPPIEAPCQGIGNGTCNYRSIGTRPHYGTVEAEGGGTTVAALASSPLVTGAGTTWITANRGRGDRITIDGTDYTILSVDSETQLTLTSGFAGSTGAGKTYSIRRKFATPRLWESCVDGGVAPACENAPTNDLVADNRGEVGVVYDDGAPYTYLAVSNAILNINGSITDPTHTITLTVDPGNRHNGTAGTGVVFNNNVNDTWAVAIQDEYATVEWLSITGGLTAGAAGFNIVAGAPQNHIVVKNNIIHNITGRGIRVNSANAVVDAINNLVYETGSQVVRINQTLAAGSRVQFLNNTFYNPTGAGISSPSNTEPHVVLRNNIIYDSSAGFNVPWINVGSSNNLSDDAAPPVGPFTPDLGHSPRGGGVWGASIASANFVDTTPTTENLHIQSGSTAENQAADLSVLFTDDIDGIVRDAPWDIGADQFSPSTHYRSIGTRGHYGTLEVEGATTTVTATNGSPIVSGAGTAWITANRGRGDRIRIDAADYTILSVDSENQLTLTEVFPGVSGSGKSYRISRKFLTLVAWEDCIDGPGGAGCEGVSSNNLVTDNRNEIGIAYKDSPFAGPLTINNSITDVSHTITLTVDRGNRHLGHEFSGGAIIDNAAAVDLVSIQDDHVTLEWLEIARGDDGVDVRNLGVGNSIVLRNLLIHDSGSSAVQLEETDLVLQIYNNVIHSASSRGIFINAAPTMNADIEIYNNTLYANTFRGIDSVGSGSRVVTLRNNVLVLNTPFNYTVDPGLITSTSSHNLASDATGVSHSPDGGGINGAGLASLNFISTSVTFVDLHIQNGSAAENVGTDLSAILTNDIDDDLRDGLWDMGADAITASAVMYRSIGSRPNYGTLQPEGTGTTVTATAGSSIVTGSGVETWLASNRGRGDRIIIGGNPYTVLRVDSNTQLQLTGPFVQAGGSGLTYSIERKFGTLPAWELCVDGTAACPGVATNSLVADQRREVGIAYADAPFGSTVAIEGAIADATHYITLTADGINRHYGIQGAGVEISGAGEITVETDYTVVQWIEVHSSGGAGFRVRDASNVLLEYLISRNNTGNGVQIAGAGNNSFTIRNSFVYRNGNDGIAGDEATDLVTVENCTVFDNADQGLEDNNSPFVVRNTISVDNNNSDYSLASVTGSNNISTDGSAPGTSPLTGRIATDNPAPGPGMWVIFQSIVATNEDLHLVDAVENDAIDNAANLSGSFTSDIDGGNRTLPWDVGADDVAATTAVELVWFEAMPRDGAVDLVWETASELDNLGFNLYRARTSAGPYERITPSLIPGLGSSPAGARYAYRDAGLENGTTYFYELEDVDTEGLSTTHGPVFATPDSDAEAGDGDDTDTDGARIRYGDPEASSIEIIERSKFEVIIDLRTEGFYAVPLDDGTVRLEIPGFESGEDGVPVKLAWIDAIAGRRVELRSARGRGFEAFDSLIPSGELVEAVGTREATVRTRSRKARPRIRRADLAKIADIAFLGTEKKASIELSPLHWDGAKLVLAKRITVRVSLRRSDPSESARGRRPGRSRSSTRNVLARLTTRNEGLHGVGFEELFAGGKALETEQLALSRLGETVPFHIEPPEHRFGPGSTLLFVGDDPKVNPHGKELVYELEWGSGGEIMAVRSAPPVLPGPTVYRDVLVREEDRIYQPALLEARDLWLWDLVMDASSKGFTFELRDLSEATEDASLRVWLQGTSDFPVAPDHHVRLYVNGTLVADVSFDGKNPLETGATLPPGVLTEGENTLTVENVGDTEAAYSTVMLDRFEVAYPRRAGAGDYVLDVTDKAQWLVDFESSGDGVRFAADGNRRYLVVPAETVQRPTIRRAARYRLQGRRQGADYIAIGPRELLDAVKPLLQHRRKSGLRVAAVAVETIYEEFGFGEPTPLAIREFLAHAYHEWRHPAPRYVLLVGDGSYDFKDAFGTGVKNQLPPFTVKTSYLWTASDPAYAAVNGDDWLPDLAIGRLPASDADEARKLAAKILAYESRGNALGDGPIVLVTDNADAAGNFDANASELSQGLLLRHEPVTISVSELGRDATRSSILGSFDQGTSLMSYIGHGGIHLWADENFFNKDDVALLSPQSQQPMLLTMNCLNGYFHFPYFDSLAEALVTAEDRGAIAAFSPSGLSLDAHAHRFHRALLAAILDGGHERLGDAVLEAQRTYLESGAFPELLRIYHLLGDPALKLR